MLWFQGSGDFAAMEVTVKQMSLTVALFGVLSFVFGVIAENKKVIVNFVIYSLIILCILCSEIVASSSSLDY